MQLRNGSLKNGFEEWIIIQFRRNVQKTLSSYHQVVDTKKLFQKESPIGIFKQSGPKNKEEEKIQGRGQNLKKH